VTAEIASVLIITLIWVSGIVVGGIAFWERFVRDERPWPLVLYITAVNLVFMGYRLATNNLWGMALTTGAVLWLASVTYDWLCRDEQIDKRRRM
jgi:hypothetical protein